MKNIFLIIPLFISFALNTYAQTASTCRDIYVWDFQDNAGKKLSDNDATTDMELALSACSDCRVFEQKANPDLAVAIKNERLSTKSPLPSEALINKFKEKGIKHILFGTVTENSGNNTIVLEIKIYDLGSKNTAYIGSLNFDKNDFVNNRSKRRETFKEYIQKQILQKASSGKLALPIFITSIGTVALVYGLIKKSGIKSDWETAIKKDPFDKAKTYSGQNTKYKTNQYIATGGGIVMAVGTFLLIKKIAERKKYNRNNGLSEIHTQPKIIIEPLISTQNYSNVGIAFRF